MCTNNFKQFEMFNRNRVIDIICDYFTEHYRTASTVQPNHMYYAVQRLSRFGRQQHAAGRLFSVGSDVLRTKLVG